MSVDVGSRAAETADSRPLALDSAPPAVTSPPPVARRSRTPSRVGAWIAPLALGVVVLGIWEALVHEAGLPELILPAPGAVLVAFWRGMLDGLLPSNALATLVESLTGFALGAVVAVPLGYAVARSRWLAWAFQPYLAASQAMPAVALAPLLVLWLGFGLPPTATLCALIVFFPATITTTLGIRALDRDVLDAARVDGANAWALARYVELPLALPAILAGLRASITLSITGAVVGEFVAGDQGLGSLLNIARNQFDSALVFATLLALGLLAAALYGLARLVERRLSYLEDQ